MPGLSCSKGRKHTPITTERQRRFVGLVRAVQKGKKIKGGVGSAVKKAARTFKKTGPKSTGAHLKEVAGKKLPESARKAGHVGRAIRARRGKK